MKRVLILYTSVGFGHKVVAENIGYHLTKGGFDVVLRDILEVESGWLVDFGKYLHKFVNLRMPWFWKWLYCSKWFARVTMPFRTKLARRNSKKTEAIVREVKPDLIICTQTTASAAVASLKQRGVYVGLFGIAFSDYHFHPYWYYKEADFYIANIREQIVELEKLGISTKKIVSVGMMMGDRVDVDEFKIRKDFGVNDGEKMILVASGSLGTGFPVQFLDKLIDEAVLNNRSWKFVIVSGKNEESRKFFKKRYEEKPVFVLGYYSPMVNLLASADLFITKPGGLSIAEAVFYGLPVLISHWLPGQEELNYDYLKKNNLVTPFNGDPYDEKNWSNMIQVCAKVLSGSSGGILYENSELILPKNASLKLVSFVKQMFHM